MNHLVIRADANSQIGIGHVMRCIALGQTWQDNGGKVTFTSHCDSASLKKLLNTEGFDLISLDKIHPDPFDLEYTLNILHKRSRHPATWLAVDGYHFDSAYQKSIKENGHKLLCIDDYGHADYYYADIILNQNITANESFYNNRESYTQLLLGTRYVLLRREFKQWQGWQRAISPIAQKMLVTLGGGDPENVTLKVLTALKQINISGLEAKIIVGPANPNLQELVSEIGDNSNLQIITSATNMPELMAWADIAITAGGSTCWELVFMKLPSMLLVTAENQGHNANILEKEAAYVNLGLHQEVTREKIASQLKELIMNSNVRSSMSQRSQALVDGYGGQRIYKIMKDYKLKLRPVIFEDCERVWKWTNDPSVRAVSFSEAFITLEGHNNWFQERIKHPHFYIVLNQDDLPVGQVRFDQKETETVISLMIDVAFRYIGYGSDLIMISCAKMFSESAVRAIHAYLKKDNDISRKAFLRAGFKELAEINYQGCSAYHLILTKH